MVGADGRVGIRHEVDPQCDAETLARALRALRDDFRRKIVAALSSASRPAALEQHVALRDACGEQSPQNWHQTGTSNLQKAKGVAGTYRLEVAAQI
jgi:hypothetical protein